MHYIFLTVKLLWLAHSNKKSATVTFSVFTFIYSRFQSDDTIFILVFSTNPSDSSRPTEIEKKSDSETITTRETSATTTKRYTATSRTRFRSFLIYIT